MIGRIIPAKFIKIIIPMLWYLFNRIIHFILHFFQTSATTTETVQILKHAEKCCQHICHMKVYKMKPALDKTWLPEAVPQPLLYS